MTDQPTPEERAAWAAQGVTGDVSRYHVDENTDKSGVDGEPITHPRLVIETIDQYGETGESVVDFADPLCLGWADKPHALVIFRTNGRQLIPWNWIRSVNLQYADDHTAQSPGDPVTGYRGWDPHRPGNWQQVEAGLQRGDQVILTWQAPDWSGAQSEVGILEDSGGRREIWLDRGQSIPLQVPESQVISLRKVRPGVDT